MTPDEPQEFYSETSAEQLEKSLQQVPVESEDDYTTGTEDAFTLKPADSKSTASGSLEDAFNGSLEGPKQGSESVADAPTLDLTEAESASPAEEELIQVMTENEPAWFAMAENELSQEPSSDERALMASEEVLNRAMAEDASQSLGGAGRRSIGQGVGSVTTFELEQRVAELQRQEQALRQEIAALKATQTQLQEQTMDAQMAIGRLVQEGLKELEQRKQALQISVEQLERRQERIQNEMRTSFAGVSQDLAIRVKSFKDYLVGSLQDLALTAEQLELPKAVKAPPQRQAAPQETVQQSSPTSPSPKFAEQSFQEQTRKIRGLLDQYRNRPDYYGPAWHLRRTFEPIHAERVSNWFFTQGGRGAIRTMGSRLQNILVASASISILHSLYGDRLRTLILAESPERLGEWRRGLQDCLGITRSDFGPDRGVALFEDPEALAMKADRAVKDGLLAFVVIDETEEQVSLSLLQFPLWLAFAPNPQVSSSSSYSRGEW
ncbi:DUF3086 domain-containing protein [Kovacikia minuta]|uniref:DUF3086 domain-containing protein n=1 Tax=Kovacikia minuta TaxID=2931930 RepID=UPI0020C7BC9D|nr:DUF3086 domain-containing protein [Kovacikia minuta]